MKKVLYAMILGAMPAVALAAPGDDLADLYFSGKNPTLTKQEKVAIAIAEKWKASGGTGTAPVAGPNGSIKFLYGAQQPSIVCAVLPGCKATSHTCSTANRSTRSTSAIRLAGRLNRRSPAVVAARFNT